MSATAASSSVERLDLESIRAGLTTRRFGLAPGWANELWETIESTNSRAAELAAMGAPHGIMVLARQQTAGRGRQGRNWLSPPDAGIYLSFLLRPGGSISSLPLYTIAAGAACAQAIYECAGIRIGLKWVNDLIYDGKKLGGILAELPSTTSGDHISTGHPSNRALIIGIGVNLTLDESTIPDELSQRVDWLERISNQPINPNLLVATIAQKLETACENLEQGNTNIILKLWKDFSITLGRTVQTAISGKPISGMAVDITPNGALIVATAEGESIQLSGGEITIRGADGGYT